MPIAKYSALLKLIKSLSKSEKRHFVLFAQRLESNRDALFLKLFNLMDKYPDNTEANYYSRLKCKNKAQFLNTKRHLYGQLLKSLRLQYEETDSVLRMRQRLDYATLLYKRGLYYESLSILNTIKNWPDKSHNLISLEITELIKRIESRHITRSRSNKNQIESLVRQASSKAQILQVETEMTNISLEVQGLYIKWGFAKNERDALMYQVYFNNQMPELREVSSSVVASVLWFQCHVWYHYMRLDFHFTYKNAVKWIEKMNRYNYLKVADPDLFMRGYHYLLTSCFYLNRKDKFEYWFDLYKDFRKRNFESFDETSRLLDFCYFDNAELNYRILNSRYKRLDNIATQLEGKIESLGEKVDLHRIMIFYYKLGLVYSYKGNQDKALDYFNRVLSNPEQHLRADIYSYCRLVHLMSHYRINNFNLVINLLPSVKSTFESNNLMNPMVELMISFLRKGSRSLNFGVHELLEATISKAENYSKSHFDKVAFLYYDYVAWLQSVNSNITIEKLKKAQS